MLGTYSMARGRTTTKVVPEWAIALKLRRVQLGISQEGIADLTGGVVSQSTMSSLEVGRQHLTDLAYMRVVALARALNWTLSDMQRVTGVDLGMTEATLVGEGSVDVYPLAAALDFDTPGMPVDHVAVAPGIQQPAVLRMDSEEMNGTGSASIRPGDHLHIDLSLTSPEEGKVYVVLDQDGVHVRQYTESRLGAIFRAENHDFEPIPAADAQVVGQVVAVAHPVTPLLN
ncbi:LexA family transcriptional regulator [Deinococcus radiophilus]|uniref:Helix-turn-helix domain-containing protein n=2 Tax=Deinococcus radiophilus TaxID=32062 RepID=A0A431W0V3_9DEIO|nr:S24 family peptidase [Deinococcus radiophilus]RTR29035.1 helix-turn-helix domain-containing protein [Deinococcus radiophilus]